MHRSEQRALHSWGSLSCFNSVWTEQTQGQTLPPASDHPPTLFPVATFRTSNSAILGLQDKPTLFFELSSLLPFNHELPDSSELLH